MYLATFTMSGQDNFIWYYPSEYQTEEDDSYYWCLYEADQQLSSMPGDCREISTQQVQPDDFSYQDYGGVGHPMSHPTSGLDIHSYPLVHQTGPARE